MLACPDQRPLGGCRLSTMEAMASVVMCRDALFPAPTMLKSGHMANQQAKVAVAAILNPLAGEAPSTPNPW